jgi:CBS domain-containing protein
VKASDIMTPDPRCVTRDETIRRTAEIMRDLEIGFVPVVDDHDSKRLAGVITDRDIAIRCIVEGYHEHHTVGDYMTSGFIAHVAPDSGFAEIFRVMQERRIRRVPVTAEGERLIGVVGIADLVGGAADSTELAALLAKILEPAPGLPRRSDGARAGRRAAPAAEIAAKASAEFVDRGARIR